MQVESGAAWEKVGVEGGMAMPRLGVHPLSLKRRRHIPFANKGGETGLLELTAGVLAFLSLFAYGLRMVDHRYGAAYREHMPAPLEEGGRFEQLSDAFRFAFGVKTVHAAEFDATLYKAAPVAREIRVEAAPGEAVPVEIWYRNLGSATWTPEGSRYLSVYTTQPRYHAGVFRHSSWLSSSHPAKLATPSVPPGELGVVKLLAQAPSVPGEYSEWMQLAAENTAWVWGAHVKIVMTVRAGTSASTQAPTPRSTAPATLTSSPAPASGSAPQAVLLLTSARGVTARANESIAFSAGYKNAGGTAWETYGLRLMEMVPFSSDRKELRHASWPDDEVAVEVREGLEPGRLGFARFTFTTPKRRGSYIVRFALTVNGTVVPGHVLEIPVEVTNDHLVPVQNPVPVSQETGARNPLVSEGGAEPTIRVGLYTTEKFESLTADGPFEARTASGALIASFPAWSSVQFWYDQAAARYRVTTGVANHESAEPIRFVPVGVGTVFTLLSHEDRPSWNSSINYNRFRGAFELRKNDRNAYVWLINELPMELYLKGMKETSNISPMEYQKSLATAARTYAMWHYTYPSKHWHFTVDAVYDQVYKGYAAEETMPNYAAAVDATRGQIVAHDGELVVTPYFSSSDGRTRAYTEVWGGTHKPWLVSVAANYDAQAGRALNGHGVGLSAWDALERANAGWTHDRILNYFYSGTTLRKLYD